MTDYKRVLFPAKTPAEQSARRMVVLANIENVVPMRVSGFRIDMWALDRVNVGSQIKTLRRAGLIERRRVVSLNAFVGKMVASDKSWFTLTEVGRETLAADKPMPTS